MNKTIKNPRGAGAPKRVKHPVKCTVTFDQSELIEFKRHAKEAGKPYNEVLRILVRHFNRAEAEKQ